MAWSNPSAPSTADDQWWQAFEGIELPKWHGGYADLADYIGAITEEDDIYYLVPASSLEEVAKRVTTLQAIVEQNAIVAEPETEEA